MFADFKVNRSLCAVLVLCSTLSFVSCTTSPSRTQTASPTLSERGLTPTAKQSADYIKSAEHYLALAQTQPTEQVEYTLMAADMFAQAENQPKAQSLLEKIQKSF